MNETFKNKVIETKIKRITISFQQDGITVCESEKVNPFADNIKRRFLFSDMQNIHVTRDLNLWSCVKTVAGAILGIIGSVVNFYLDSPGWGFLFLIVTIISLLFLGNSIYDGTVHIIVHSGISMIDFEIKNPKLEEAEELATTINRAWKASHEFNYE